MTVTDRLSSLVMDTAIGKPMFVCLNRSDCIKTIPDSQNCCIGRHLSSRASHFASSYPILKFRW